MDLKKFEALSEAPRPAKYLIWQDWSEWRAFLEFASAHLSARGVEKPLVVEIGVMHNEQRTFYRELMGADHISIDINLNNGADITGDSSKPETLAALKERLAGRAIDLLFIDGNHTYEGVKADTEMYGPLVKHLIAFHDVNGVTRQNDGVNGWFREYADRAEYMTAVFYRAGKTVDMERQKFVTMGIGVVIKGDGK